jgi:hypothetical protein
MILRIMGEGQLRLEDDHLAELNELDDALADAVNDDDETRFEQTLTELISRVRSLGTPVPDDYLGGSDLILPGPASSLTEVRDLLGEEGLIPG